MFLRLIILFTFIPLLELMLLIKVGEQIGTLNTIAIVILTGVAGAGLARAQGFGIISKIQQELQNGQIPGESLIDGVMVLAGALLLLTPGLITDSIGFCFLLPATRKLLKKYIKSYFQRKINTGEIHANYTVEK